MHLTAKFRILRIVLWLCAIVALANISVTAYFFITKDPVPYYDSLSCDTCGAPNDTNRLIYSISNDAIIISTIVAIITTAILILLSALNEHDLEHRAARKANRIALCAAIILTILAIILTFVYTNTILSIL